MSFIMKKHRSQEQEETILKFSIVRDVEVDCPKLYFVEIILMQAEKKLPAEIKKGIKKSSYAMKKADRRKIKNETKRE